MTAGSAVPGIALESDARVATSIISADTLAILTLHIRWTTQSAGAAVVIIGLCIEWTIATAVPADVSIHTSHSAGAAIVIICLRVEWTVATAIPADVVIHTAGAAATAVVVVRQVVDEALTIAIGMIWVPTDAHTAASVLIVGSSNSWVIIICLAESNPACRPRNNRSIKLSGHNASCPLKGV